MTARRRLDIDPAKAAEVAAWARKVGVYHSHQPDCSLRLSGVTPALRERLAKDVGPLSEAEARYKAAAE